MEMNFREFLNGTAPAAASYDTGVKMWRLEKDQAMQYWQSLKPNSPILFDPIEPGKKGSTFGEDGLRLTGSRKFIDSVIGRLKDIMQYENPSTKLNVVYRQVQYKGSNTPDKNSSFVFYAQVKSRDKKALGTTDGTINPTAGPAGPTSPGP
jgi:hypothetical protein